MEARRYGLKVVRHAELFLTSLLMEDCQTDNTSFQVELYC